MDMINKITKSRGILKKYLDTEWDTDSMSNYSNEEIKKIYTSKKINTDISFGKASALNITLNHKTVKSHRLHVIYYNFPELNASPLKINKTCGDKMLKLYVDGIINPEDSIILIIADVISENIEKTIEDVYKRGQEELLVEKLSDNIIEENEKLNDSKLRNEHFRNIHIFNINAITFDPLKHVLVPKHECIRKENEIEAILKITNTTRSQLPVILRKDPVAKLFRLAPGDICKITRTSEKCGEYIYYRICE